MVSNELNTTQDAVASNFETKENAVAQGVDTCSNSCSLIDAAVDNTNLPVDKSFKEKMREPDYKERFFHTVSLCFAFLMLGITVGQRGPSLLDLQIITNTDMQRSSVFITAMSAGYTCGTFPIGFLYDKMSKPLLLFVSCLTTGILVGVLPFCSNYILMLAVIFLGAMPMAGIDIGGNADIIRMWGKEGRSYMQAIHFCFAVGSVIGPLVTEPFLTPRQREHPHHPELLINSSTSEILDHHNNRTTENKTSIQAIYSKYQNSTTYSVFQNSKTYTPFKTSSTSSPFQNSSTYAHLKSLTVSSSLKNSSTSYPFQNSTTYAHLKNLTVSSSFQNSSTYSPFQNLSTSSPFNKLNGNNMNRTTVVYIAYIIVAVVCVIIAIPFLLLHCQQQPIKENDEQRNVKNNHRGNLGLKTFTITLLLFIFLNILYIAIEDTMANFMLMFVVKSMNWSKVDGTLITSTYWAAFAASRFLGIFLIRCLSPIKCLFMVYSSLIVSCIGLLYSAALSFHAGVWVSLTGAGLSMGVIFPTNYNLISELVTVTGKIASLIAVTASVGSIANPAILGPLMQHYSPMWYVYLILGESVGCLVCFLVLLVYSGTCRKPVTGKEFQTVVVSDVNSELMAKESETDRTSNQTQPDIYSF